MDSSHLSLSKTVGSSDSSTHRFEEPNQFFRLPRFVPPEPFEDPIRNTTFVKIPKMVLGNSESEIPAIDRALIVCPRGTGACHLLLGNLVQAAALRQPNGRFDFTASTGFPSIRGGDCLGKSDWVPSRYCYSMDSPEPVYPSFRDRGKSCLLSRFTDSTLMENLDTKPTAHFTVHHVLDGFAQWHLCSTVDVVFVHANHSPRLEPRLNAPFVDSIAYHREILRMARRSDPNLHFVAFWTKTGLVKFVQIRGGEPPDDQIRRLLYDPKYSKAFERQQTSGFSGNFTDLGTQVRFPFGFGGKRRKKTHFIFRV